MSRCPTCHRRLAPAASCARDGSTAVASPALAGSAPGRPRVPGVEATTLLGAGAYGAVWAATTTEAPVGQPVAVKVSHDTTEATAARFRREAAILTRVGPPHLPAFVAAGKLADGRSYLSMERLVGPTLAEEIAGFHEPPPLEVVGLLGSTLIEAVAALHERGVSHRDLKPENVILTGAGAARVARLIDFGLALTPSLPALERTTTGMAVGTPEYMAPERIAGEDGDFPADVYALGAILFELLTLRTPFVGDTREIEYAQLSFRPPSPSRFAPVPDALEEIVLRCLAKNPARRFPDGMALHAAFLAALADLGGFRERPAPAAPREEGPPRAERQKVALIFMHDPVASAVDIQGAIQPFGGQLAHLAGGRCVCAFTHRAGDHPGQRALGAAEALVARRLAARLIVDVGTVLVKPRPSGPPRVTSPLFSEGARFPRVDEPEGIQLTPAAREMLPDVVCTPSVTRPEHFALVPRADQDLLRTVELAAREAIGPLFGREDELQGLSEEAARALAERRPRVATVLGGQGIGKTRLRFELAHLLPTSLQGVEVIELVAKEAIGPEADEILAELLRRTLDLPRQPPPGAEREPWIARLGESESEAAAAGLVLGWLTPDDARVRAMAAAPGALRANAARAGMTALARRAGRQPVVVLLDGAHWADDALLDALEQATVSELPLWVCAFASPAFTASRPTWGQRAAGHHLVPLGPLDRASASELCRHLLEPAAQVPQAVVDTLIDRAEGVPLMIHDLIRGLRREGLVRRQGPGAWVLVTEVLDRLSDSPLAQWLASRELDELSADLVAHARLLALLPLEVTVEEVEGVLAAMPPDLLDAFPLDGQVGLQRLRQCGLLQRRPSGRHAFRNEGIREAIARTVNEGLAARIHRAALQYHLSPPDAGPDRLARLAWHAAAAGEREEAAAAYLAVAEGAGARHSYLEAELFYSRCLGQLVEGDAPRRLRALRGRGIMRYRLGRHDESLADLGQAHVLAQRGDDRLLEADLLLDEAMALDWLLDWPRSRALTERARALIPGDAPPALRARLLLALGRSLHRFNADAEAAGVLREAERLAATCGDEGYEVVVIADLVLGLLLPMIGLTDEAEARLNQVQRLCEEKGDELHLAAMWQNRSLIFLARDQRDRFEEENARVRAHAQRLGNATVERYAHLNLSNYCYWRWELDPALEYAHKLIEVDRRFRGEGAFRPDGLVLLARILFVRGDEAGARATVEQVARHQAEARAAGQSDRLLAPNDELLLDMTALLVAGAAGPAWEALLERARTVSPGQELIEVIELAGLAAERRGDLAAARRCWEEALAVGARIPNVMSGRVRGRLARLAADPQ